MANATATSNQERTMRIAVDRIVGFAKQFGEAHLNLACHAAFPLALTPDLLYQIWANFLPQVPWTAVARVLLSRLCRQVGYEMYEIDIAVRNLLLKELKEQFGQGRFGELADFLREYVKQRLNDNDPDTQDLAQAQEWTALMYTEPSEAMRELAEAIQLKVKQEDMAEVFRLASLVETFADPLKEAGFEPLLVYSRGMERFVRGNLEEAATELGTLLDAKSRIQIDRVNLPVPKQIEKLLPKHPMKVQPKPSNVRLIPSPEKGSVIDLLIIDPNIAKAWNESPQNIWVHDGTSLASLNIEDLRQGRIIWPDVRWIELQDLFLPEFLFINLNDALPGALLPNETQPLAFKGQRITPLLPLNPILLEYLTPEDLIGRMQLHPFNGSEGPQVRVILDLPLVGMDNDEKRPWNCRVFKDYQIQEQNLLAEVPVLEVWPNFLAAGWHEYYTFYYDAEYGELTFQVQWSEAKDVHIFTDGRGSYQIAQLEEYPTYINCQDKDENLLGIILLWTPEEIQATGSWTVGVDFGPDFTNVYVNRKGIVESLFLESLHLKVTDVQVDTRLPPLFEYFIPESFIPPDKPLPLRTVLTTRGSTDKRYEKVRPIFDGRIYVPDRNRFAPQQDWIKTDLKWTRDNFIYNKLFLKHLALHITALAAKNRVNKIQWSLSYPSNFSRGDQARYAQIWLDIAKELQQNMGIVYSCPEFDNLDYFRTESLAIAQYFADREGHQLVSATCILMKDDTSDISIWEKNQLVHQCSVQLAGRDLFSQFLEMNPNFLIRKFEVDANEWNGLREGNFNAKLDVLLRLEGENWLHNKRAFVEEEADFQGLLRLIAIGTAGLYYYVGTILGVLWEDGRFSKNEITPVYIGGNGSRLLNWLAIGGRFDRHSEINDLLSRMLSKGSGFEDTGEKTRLSKKPQDEVACGLVLSRTKLKGLKRKTKVPLIAGEDCIVNGEEIGWKDRLELEGNIEDFQVPYLMHLQYFMDEFNLALKELEIDGLKPLEGYQVGKEGLEPSYNDQLWRNTHRELTSVLLGIKGDADNIRVDPPFILGLKALLRVLAKEWAGR